MATVDSLPNGQWIMTYGYGGGPGFSDYSFPVYYRISSSPLTFSSATGYPVVAGTTHPLSSPNVVWTPSGGADGSIAVSCGTSGQVFLNTALGVTNKWTALNTPQPSAYSRYLRIMNDTHHLLIMGGGNPLPSTTNKVGVSVMLI
jgi:hypothetical protein